MKVLHLSSALTWRGGEQQISYLYQELQKKNIEQMVSCPVNSELFLRLKKQNVGNLFPYKKVSGMNINFALQLKRICKEFQPSIIHVHDSHAHTAAFISSLLGNKTPIVLSRRVDFQVGKNFFSRLKYNHKNIVKIICVSDAIKKIMEEVISAKSKLITIHSGIDLGRFPHNSKTGRLYSLLGLKENTFIIGNTSAIASHKDYFTFTDTAALILEALPDVRFVIIGDGPLTTELKSYIESKNLGDKIFMLGFREDVPKLLPDFDVFFMSSKTEGLGTSILDAFACNVAVVSTNVGGIPELIEHQKTGLLSSVGDIHSLAKHIVSLHNNQLLKASIINNARQVLTNFSKELMAEKTLQVYKEFCGI
ncbi:MAG: glycosyltransferase [Bacteroidales bacterium]|nr:glycosyltransferase [Bacteroidales bacterium]